MLHVVSWCVNFHSHTHTQELEKEGKKVRVVSMVCWELFEEQDQDYKDSVLHPDVEARVSVEAAVPFGWRE